MKYFHLLVAALILLFVFTGCNSTASNGNNSNGNGGNSKQGRSNQPTTKEPTWGVRNKTSNCTINGPLQDIACTPGDIIQSATKEQICQPGYARTVRNVPTSEKNQVYAEYGITHHSTGEYEVDHLVSLELGGSNDISNLWPEAASPKPGFHEKDKVENYLHDQVCSGAVSLKQAQIEIATNWLDVYNRMPSK
ncbi:HNH endonuclease signature motif containing protein [Ktedonosporobacter rubrisoli]|uniref:HNH endonuclease signature motif containing protein n=1 Tax=Ktedonosporobacter rubrisoli TaxID=2509675 RepID=UPI001A925672|nr:HNH endonuclease signature motif containing protein [Ktedonosporobacter rubrisoli]